jgi:hypothetical protein
MAYNLLYPIHLIMAQSMTSTVTSNPVEVQRQDNIGVQLNWTGTPVGTFSVEVSMDYAQDYLGNVLNAGNWITLPLSPTIIASGSADTAYIDLNQLSATYIRIVYAPTSSTGTLDAYVDAKGV